MAKNMEQPNKKTTKRSKEEVENYKKALQSAENKFLRLCLPDKDRIDDIITNMTYLLNWRGYTHLVDLSDDNITFDDFSFSKKRFISNKFFKKKLIEVYGNRVGDVFLRTQLTHDNKFKIIISKRSY